MASLKMNLCEDGTPPVSIPLPQHPPMYSASPHFPLMPHTPESPSKDGNVTLPYRTNIDWSIDSYRSMRRQIEQRQTYFREVRYKIAMFGGIQTGKSSWINTVLSSMLGKRVYKAVSGPAMFSLTRHLAKYPVRVPSHEAPLHTDVRHYHDDDYKGEEALGDKRIPVLLCDTMGFEVVVKDDEAQCMGPKVSDVELILDGKIDEGYGFHPDGIPLEEMRKHEGIRQEKVNLVVIVWDAFTESTPDVIINRLKEVINAARDRTISCCVLVTKIDQHSEEVDRNLANVFICDKIHQVLDKVSQKLDMEISHVFPVLNYTFQDRLVTNIDCLTLHTLSKLLDLADITLELQQGYLPVDKVVNLLKNPWLHIDLPGDRGQVIKELTEKTRNVTAEGQCEAVNVLIAGHKSAGKSEYINAIFAALRGSAKKVQFAPTGPEKETPVTTHFNRYQALSNWNLDPDLKLRFFDTMGFTCNPKQGIVQGDLLAAIKGLVPIETGFNPLRPVNVEDQQRKANLKDRMHAVVLVVDAKTVAESLSKSKGLNQVPSSFAQDPHLKEQVPQVSSPQDPMVLLKETYEQITALGIPCTLVVCNLDQLCHHVARNAGNVYRSSHVRDCIVTLSRKLGLGIPVEEIFPVVSVADRLKESDKDGAQEARHILLLHSLHHVVDRAVDYISMQQPILVEPPVRAAKSKCSTVNIVLTMLAVGGALAGVLITNFYNV